jgi:hypothetical protein
MKNVRGVNNLKLRAGYGETGVIVGGSYLSQTLLKYEGDFYDNGKWVKGLVARVTQTQIYVGKNLRR